MSLFKQKNSLRNKLAFRFGILLSIFTIAMLVTFYILNNSININNKIFNIYTPSIKKLESYKLNIINSKTLINNWVATPSESNHPDKLKLKEILSVNIKSSQKELESYSTLWNEGEKEKLGKLILKIDSMLNDYKKVMTAFSTFESYSDPMVMMGQEAMMIQDGGSINNKYNNIVKTFDSLIATQSQFADEASSEMNANLNNFKNTIILIILITIAIGCFITITTIKSITLPIIQVKEILVNMGKGILPDNTLNTTGDEIGEMSSALNHLNEGLRKTAAYADRIGNGDMEATFNPLSDEDLLGNSLLEMGKKLKKLNEEDLKRNWAATGMAEFAQLLRENTNMQLLFDNIISKLVKYVNANQGAMFLVNDGENENDVHLKMASCYAYDRKKYIEKTIQPGEGLVGQCYLEKDIIYLTDVPDKYVHITSGLGHATPRCVAIFPLIINDNIMGVIELASFKVLDKFDIDFINKLCENIAGTISNVKINQRTVALLESSKISQQNMMEKEEEMRQNLEELTATQEEMNRREAQYVLQIQELERTLQERK